MVSIQINGILNVSLQVGDLIYASSTYAQNPSADLEQDFTGNYEPVNQQGIIGILRRITVTSNINVLLDVDDTGFAGGYVINSGDFIMFSKNTQQMGDMIGYYAKATFKNNSRVKAEIFSVGSEITINSK